MINDPFISNSLQSTSGLPLGWRPSAGPGLGFGAAPVKAPAEMLAYAGDAHLMTVAPTGAGKGVGVVVPTALTYSGPMAIFDTKGEIYHITHRRRRELGQAVYKIDPFGVIEEATDSLNPLDLFTLAGADIDSDSQALAHLLSVGNRGVKDPFWDLNGCGLHSGVIGHLAFLHRTNPQGFVKLCELLMSDDVVYNLAVLLDTCGKTMPRMAYREIAAFLQMSERDTRPGVLATAQSYIKPINGERVARTLEKSTVPLDGIVRGDPMTVYIIIPPDRLDSHKGLLKLWVGTLLKAVTSRRVLPPNRTLFMLDEAAQLGNFAQLETVITLCRGYGVQCWTIWQDLAQLQGLYPTSWRTMLNNCGVVQVFGLNNLKMASDWTEYLPLSASRLVSLKRDEQAVLVQNEGVVVSRRLNYLTDAAFAGLADPNPFHASRTR
jgi:type IV secretion system protein VirD4